MILNPPDTRQKTIHTHTTGPDRQEGRHHVHKGSKAQGKHMLTKQTHGIIHMFYVSMHTSKVIISLLPIYVGQNIFQF